ncbi:MAG TPA: peptidase M24 family protein [Acidimicrobiaceae bacterium]|nr:peptidase M24 family protein [Acidimicrobiaceae bacterium]
MFEERLVLARNRMAVDGVDVLLLSAGADLPYFCGYEAMPLERLTMLVVPREGQATLVVPHLEAPRVVERPDVFDLATWRDGEDPIGLVIDRLPGGWNGKLVAAIGDQTWGGFVVDLLNARPGLSFTRASKVTAPIRMVKDEAEVKALRSAAAAVDRILSEVQAGEVPLVGRTEVEVAAQIGRRILDEGHSRINFVIVASGPNAASPHHEPSEREIRFGESVLFDIGGTMPGPGGVGYCSDITRCVHLGEPQTEFADAYEVLRASQAAGVMAATIGTPCEEVDAVSRRVLEEAGYGRYFVHRLGHGIGVEAHEQPNLVAGNNLPLDLGHVFSVEPGIYVPDRWGMRLEDIVVATADGPDPLNRIEHGLAVVDA